MRYFNHRLLINTLLKSANFGARKLLNQFFNFFAYGYKRKIDENGQFCIEKKCC